jgi:hypothetical protein
LWARLKRSDYASVATLRSSSNALIELYVQLAMEETGFLFSVQQLLKVL